MAVQRAQPIFRWGMQQGGKAASPPSVGGALSAPDPGGHGGYGGIAGLIAMTNLGMNVYDTFYGKDRAQKDLLEEQRQLTNLQKQLSISDAMQKEGQTTMEQRVAGATGQKYTPEAGQYFPGLRPGAQEVRPVGNVGPTTGPLPGTPPTDLIPNVVRSPWVDVGRETQRGQEAARVESGRILEQTTPPGPVRERAAAVLRGPQITLPSQVPGLVKGLSETGQAVTQEQKGLTEQGQLEASIADMDQYRKTGDSRYLYSSISRSSGGGEKLAQLDAGRQQMATKAYHDMTESYKLLLEAFKSGNEDVIRRQLQIINMQQIGFSRALENPLAPDPNPQVHVFSNRQAPGWVYGKYNQQVSIPVPRDTAEKYVAGKLNPNNPQDLYDLGMIEMGIPIRPDGKLDPNDATALKNYVVARGGASIETVGSVHKFVDSMTGLPAGQVAQAEGPPAEPPRVDAGGRPVPPAPGEPSVGQQNLEYVKEAGKKVGELMPAPAEQPSPYPGGVGGGAPIPGDKTPFQLWKEGAGMILDKAGKLLAPQSPLGGRAGASPSTGPSALDKIVAPQVGGRANLTAETPKIQAAAQQAGVDSRFLIALRQAENGGPGREFGVLSEPAPTYDDQLRIAALSVAKALGRFQATGRDPMGPDGMYTPEFIQEFSDRYARVGAPNDPKNLNKNHFPNLMKFYRGGIRPAPLVSAGAY